MREKAGTGPLLSIDVHSELDKLAQARAPTPDHVAAECVRRALWARASEIRVQLRPGQLELQDDGPPIPRGQLAALCRLLDRSRPLEDRHAALVAIEASPIAPLLSLATARTLLVECRSSRSTDRLVVSPGSRPTLESTTATGTGTRLRAAIPGLHPRGAGRHVGAVSRFAPASVTLGDRHLPDGLAGALARMELPAPLRGTLALMPDEEEAQVWMLSGGAVVTRVTLPGRPPFTASLELGQPGAFDIAPATLRERAAPLEPELIRQLGRLLASVGGESRSWAPSQRAHFRRTVLAAAAAGCPGLDSLPLIPVVRPGARTRLVSLRRFRVAAQPGAVTALFPDQTARDFRLGPQPVFILDALERGRLASLYGARFVAPSRRSQPRALERLRAAAADLVPGLLRVFDPFAPEPRDSVPVDALTPEERSLARRLRDRLNLPVAFRAGAAPPAWRGGRLWLSRREGSLQAALDRVRRDDAWLPVSALALLPDRLPPGAAIPELDAVYLLDSPRPNAYPAARPGEDSPHGAAGGPRLSASKEKPS